MHTKSCLFLKNQKNKNTHISITKSIQILFAKDKNHKYQMKIIVLMMQITLED